MLYKPFNTVHFIYRHYLDGHYETDVYNPLQLLNKW